MPKSARMSCGSRSGRSHVQSLEFDRDRWTVVEAKKWAIANGCIAEKAEIKPTTIRLPQSATWSPACAYRKHAIGTKDRDGRSPLGIRLLLEFPKRKPGQHRPARAAAKTARGAKHTRHTYAVHRSRSDGGWELLGRVSAGSHDAAIGVARKRWRGVLRVGPARSAPAHATSHAALASRPARAA